MVGAPFDDETTLLYEGATCLTRASTRAMAVSGSESSVHACQMRALDARDRKSPWLGVACRSGSGRWHRGSDHAGCWWARGLRRPWRMHRIRCAWH